MPEILRRKAHQVLEGENRRVAFEHDIDQSLHLFAAVGVQPQHVAHMPAARLRFQQRETGLGINVRAAALFIEKHQADAKAVKHRRHGRVQHLETRVCFGKLARADIEVAHRHFDASVQFGICRIYVTQDSGKI